MNKRGNFRTKTGISIFSRIILFAAIVLFFSVSLPCNSAERTRPSETEVYSKFYGLKPLPKIHYSWGMWDQFKDWDDRPFYQLARITHSLCVKGEWVTAEQIDKCVYTCARVNKSKPKILCSIGVNFSPWHRKFGKELPPTDRGPTYYAEIDFFAERMTKIKHMVVAANKKYKSDVQIGALFLDSERFYVKPGNKAWNEGLRKALDAIHLKAASIFPKARIDWYGRGMRYVARENRWVQTPCWTGKEITPSLTCALYSIPELEKTRELYRKTVELADKMGIEDVTPVIALAAGYKPESRKSYRWQFDWDYDLAYSHQIGSELNILRFAQMPERFAPYKRAKVILLYPAPFDKRVPAWPKHFIAYVRGATGVADINDL